MIYQFKELAGEAFIRMIEKESFLEHVISNPETKPNFHTIAWNTGPPQIVFIDSLEFVFESNSILPIMLNQRFRFEHPEFIVAWQFNREFYCIIDHDKEVGCVGFLFFGPNPVMFMKPDLELLKSFEDLKSQFIQEFESDEIVKADMLRMLLVQLIIKLTRLAKKQNIELETDDEKFDLMRHFNLQVEIHFRQQKQVQFYAGLLNKSPKTIANVFSLYSKQSPLQIIHNRVLTEANRLLHFSNKSIKEIAYYLGFEDIAGFSKFYKNQTGFSPSQLKKGF
jgi:AraC family transcriptional activator of pobA